MTEERGGQGRGEVGGEEVKGRLGELVEVRWRLIQEEDRKRNGGYKYLLLLVMALHTEYQMKMVNDQSSKVKPRQADQTGLLFTGQVSNHFIATELHQETVLLQLASNIKQNQILQVHTCIHTHTNTISTTSGQHYVVQRGTPTPP